MRRDDAFAVSKQGDALTINGTTYDFSPLPDGVTLPASATDCEYIVRPIERTNGVLHITLLLPHGADASEAARFPAPIINPPDGTLELPK